MDEIINEYNEDESTIEDITNGEDQGADTDATDTTLEDNTNDTEESTNKDAKIISNGYSNYNREYRFECPNCKTIFLMTSKQLSSYYENIPTFPYAPCPKCDNTSAKGIEVTTHSKPGYI